LSSIPRYANGVVSAATLTLGRNVHVVDVVDVVVVHVVRVVVHVIDT
jgi:hypothetical protein